MKDGLENSKENATAKLSDEALPSVSSHKRGDTDRLSNVGYGFFLGWLSNFILTCTYMAIGNLWLPFGSPLMRQPTDIYWVTNWFLALATDCVLFFLLQRFYIGFARPFLIGASLTAVLGFLILRSF